MQGIVNSAILFLFGEGEGGSWFTLNKIIAFAVTVIIIPFAINIITNIISEKRRKKLKNYFIKSNEKPSKIVPEDVFGEMRVRIDKGFNKGFYVMRPEYDQRLLNHISEGKNVLIVGEPLSGKTRLAYKTIKSLESYRIWIPKQTKYDNSIFPYLKSKKGIVIFDDMDSFTSEQSLPGLIKELVAKGFIIIGTCKKGIELETLGNFFTRNSLSIFHETIEIKRVEDEQLEDVKQKAKDKSVQINEGQFNGTIGSLFYPLEAMKASALTI